MYVTSSRDCHCVRYAGLQPAAPNCRVHLLLARDMWNSHLKAKRVLVRYGNLALNSASLWPLVDTSKFRHTD